MTRVLLAQAWLFIAFNCGSNSKINMLTSNVSGLTPIIQDLLEEPWKKRMVQPAILLLPVCNKKKILSILSFADYTARLWHQCFLQPCDRLLQEWVLVTDKESTCHKRYYCGNTSSSHNAVLEIANLWFSRIGSWRWAAQRDSQGKVLSIGVWLWKTVYNAVLNAKFALLIGQSGARIPKWSCFTYTKI